MVKQVYYSKIAPITLICFVLILFFIVPDGTAAEESPSPLLHQVEGREECLLCHGTDGVVPSPANHVSFSESMCLSCHVPATEAPEQTDVAEETPPVNDGETTNVPSESGLSDYGESCLQCHGQPGISMTLQGGEVLSLYIDTEVYEASIHGNKLHCTDCHTTITSYPHSQVEIANKREYSIAQYELCKHCHFDNYTKTLDSIHYAQLSSGDLLAPICTDCHGAHDVTSPSQPRASISVTCSKCHRNIYDQYVNSVHGTALIEQNNYDVPVCTDCHESHTIVDPRTAAFRLKSVHICSNCHSDAELMSRYGISPNVVTTYLNDFHGRTVALVEQESRDIWVEEAVCTDCHGIHDIQPVDNPNSPVIKANLTETCAKCHENATINFPNAWLSHYEPSLDNAPVIFIVKWFYRIMIPFIVLGLSIHILLDLWRRVTNR